MEFSAEHRRAVVALACKLAWADGVVTDGEREYVRNLVMRIASDAVPESELDAWLTSPTAGPEVEYLPKGIDDYFMYEALQLMEADGDIDDSELEFLNGLTKRLFNNRAEGTQLAQIALGKRAVSAAKGD